MTTLIKKIKPVINSRAELERILNQIVSDQIARENLVAERDARIQEIRNEYGDTLDAIASKIEMGTGLVSQWAECNPEPFGKIKSMSIDGITIGWRTGQPTLKTRKKMTWKKVVEVLKEMGGAAAKKFLREKVEPNKETLLAARHDQPEILAQLQLEVVQSEVFYIDPPREGQENKTIKTKL